MKFCGRCRSEHPIGNFGIRSASSDGLSVYCRDCTRQINRDQRAKRRANGKWRDYYLRRRREWREGMLARVYGITGEQYAQLLERQNHVCAICGEDEVAVSKFGYPKRLAVDHDHRTGGVRGLLCSACNNAIGGLRDRPDLLARAIDYLSREYS